MRRRKLMLADLMNALDEIYEVYGDIEIKVYDTKENRLKSSVVTLGKAEGEHYVSCVVLLDKESLLKIPPSD